MYPRGWDGKSLVLMDGAGMCPPEGVRLAEFVGWVEPLAKPITGAATMGFAALYPSLYERPLIVFPYSERNDPVRVATRTGSPVVGS
jgi:hypothetical protein